MTIVRLRAEVEDERGRLSHLASAIAACGGNILAVDVHFLDGSRVADEFVIELAGGHVDGLATALRRAGGANIDVEQLDEHAVVDPVARAVDVAAQLFTADPFDRRLAPCIAQLVRADCARLVVEQDAEPAALLHRVSGVRAPSVSRERSLLAADRPADLWVLVVPDHDGHLRRWMVVERAAPPFSSSEIGRVAAVLRLAAAATTASRSAADSARRTVGPPPIAVRRRPATFFRTRPAYATTPDRQAGF